MMISGSRDEAPTPVNPPLPQGTVTFLFTDIQGSTRLWEEQPDAMRLVLPRHDALLRAAIETNNGHVFKTVGDAFCAVFATAPEALDAALTLQQSLGSLRPSATSAVFALKVRVALHTGAAEERGGDYFGPAVNRVARLLAAGHGGQVLLSSVTQDLVQDDLSPGVALKDLGSHRLRDLQRPEHVFQLLHPDVPSDFPPLRSLDALPNNLPQQVTSFVGREKEIAEVKRLLTSTRLLTLTGVGGTGKSRLSLQVAAELLQDYPDGVWLVELAPLSDPCLVPQAVATVLSVREEPGQDLIQTLIRCLKNRHLLLILDNCEHLLSASAQLADTILRQCPEVTILASSREGLGIAGETLYRIPSLTLPNPGTLPPGGDDPPSDLLEYEAVRLFIDRARAVQPDFTLTTQNLSAMAAVCQRLDGIPLALELAAARVRALPVEQIASRLNDRFRLLTGGTRSALPRQQTLRALIDWSYDLLAEPERVLFRRLSVVVGGCDLEAAGTVCANDDTEAWELLDLLTSLVDKSLLLYEEREGAARYRLLETLRQYGSDRLLEAGEAEAVRGRHRDHFLRWAEEAEPCLFGAEQARWLERFEEEHDNLRAALEWGLADELASEAALRLAGAMGQFWRRRLHVAEGKQWLQRALEADHETSPAARAKALYALADLLFVRDDPASVPLFRESVTLYRRLKNSRGLGWALIGLGYAVKELARDPESARSCFEEALILFEQCGDKRGIGWARGELGFLASNQGDLNTARVLFRESATLLRESGDRYGVAWALHGAGEAAWAQGDRQRGRSLLEESLALRREIGDVHGLRWLLASMSGLYGAAGEHEAAYAILEQQLTLARDMGDDIDTARYLGSLAGWAWRQGDQTRARALIEQSLALAHRTQDREAKAWVRITCGQMARESGEYRQAINHFEECLALCKDPSFRPNFPVAWVLRSMAQALLAVGDIQRAEAGVVEALEAANRRGQRLDIVLSLAWVAGVALGREEAQRAAVLFGAAQPRLAAETEPVVLAPIDQAWLEQQMAAVRAALTDETFSQAWEEGRAMTLEEAVTYALEEKDA